MMKATCGIRGWCVLLVAAGAAGPVSADDGGNGWYVLPSYHQAGVEKASMKYRQASGDINFDTTFGDDTGPGVAVGYAFDAPYRVDAEYQSQSNDLKVPSSVPLVSSSLKSTTYAVNVWRDFSPWHQMRPYVGIGLGGGTLELNDLDTNFMLGRLGAGLQWYFRSRMALDVGYRYQFATSNPELTGNSQKLETDWSTQSVQIGLRYDFGGS
jgi:opacity protein-like surface antigen